MLQGSSINTSEASKHRNDYHRPDYVNYAYTAVSGDILSVDTTDAAVTITLPANPGVGDVVVIQDAQANCNTNNITVGRNSQKINSGTSNITLSVNGVRKTYVFQGGAQGWVSY